MKSFAYYTGTNNENTKSYVVLEEDLIAAIKGFDGLLSMYSNMTEYKNQSSQEKKIRIYEIPSQGAINMQVSSTRSIEIEGLDVGSLDGLVTCLGFDESSKAFKKIDKELTQLCEHYQRDRKK